MLSMFNIQSAIIVTVAYLYRSVLILFFCVCVASRITFVVISDVFRMLKCCQLFLFAG